MDKTLLKGLATLEALAAQGNQPLSLSAFAERLGLTKSNTHRTLQTLAHAGYAVQDANGTYRASLKLFELGMLQREALDVRQLALPTLQRLALAVQETVHLSVLDSLEVLYVEKIDSPHPVRAYTTVGGRAPAYCVATGKAMLAFQSEAYLAALEDPLPAHSPHTLPDLAALHAQLARVRREGVAYNTGEWRDSVGGVAAPILDGLGTAVAAIGLSGPLSRFTLARMREQAPALGEAAKELSRAMGYRVGTGGAPLKETPGRPKFP
ncbi:MAG: IclR family transcriptional regulator [Pigmentiphaga sp.]|nr:IclR family transcriptional regulator [Pigmentiphaga sp.]